MDDHARAEYDEFALHAGVAVEKLGKAVLVSKNPIYIAEMRGGVDMLFHLGGHQTARKVRTIGAGETISRLRALGALIPDTRLDLLIDLRNGVAHAANSEQARSLLPALAHSVKTLHESLSERIENFWGRWSDAAHLAIDEQQSQIHRDVQVRILQARHAFEDRFSGLPEGSLESYRSSRPKTTKMTATEGGRTLAINNFQRCPACKGWADLLMRPTEISSNSITLVPNQISCTLCRLDLIGREELDAALEYMNETTKPDPEPNGRDVQGLVHEMILSTEQDRPESDPISLQDLLPNLDSTE